MITFLKTWANQIIVAVIIATIFEMILPSGNNKKYIKMVIGLYVLFTIIQPIVIKFTGESIEISNFNYKKYFDEEAIQSTLQDFENNNSKLIKQAYIDNIKNDIKVKVNRKGYELLNLNINIQTKKQENYGAIENIILTLKKNGKNQSEEKENNNTIKIEDVEINISNENSENVISKPKELSNISEKEKIQLIEYLSNEYSIDKINIIIN